jgi:hypothetical protein
MPLFLAESNTFTKVLAGLHRFLVPSLTKTQIWQIAALDCSDDGESSRRAIGKSLAFLLTFRTLCWNSEAILPELLKRGEAELATDAFMSHKHLFLHTIPLNHNFRQIGRPISDPLGQASGMQLSHRPSGQ